MSSLALMRWLEASPSRYDAGMRWLSFGRVPRVHSSAVDAAVRKPGDRVLEIGCGTGSVTARLVAAGARVVAIDQSAEMLERARASVGAGVEFFEQTAAEIDRFDEGTFDAVVICLCLSDMSASERRYVLEQSRLRLAPGGVLVVGDELVAPPGWCRWLQRALRAPQAILGWLLVGSVSKPIPDLACELDAAGFEPTYERRWSFGTLGVMVARARSST